MKNIVLISFLLALVLESHAQITLKKFDDPSKPGYESILFETVDTQSQANQGNASSNTRKEFNIQENNPYNQLSYSIKKTKLSGARVYSISDLQAAELFRIDQNDSRNIAVTTASHYFVTKNKNFAVIGYNLFGYDSEGEVTERARKSTIKIINQNGNEIYDQEINSDSYEFQITPNGKYMSYAYGEATHSSSPQNFGLRIVETNSKKIILDVEARLDFSYLKYDFLILRGWENNSFRNWILNFNTSNIYEIDGDFIPISSTTFEKRDHSVQIINLSPYKIK